MKKVFKGLAMLLAAAVFAFGAVSCSNGSSNDSDSNGSDIINYGSNYSSSGNASESAVYASTVTGNGFTGTVKLICYDDSSFVMTESVASVTLWIYKGTYEITSGNFTNGNVKFTFTEVNPLPAHYRCPNCRQISFKLKK